MTVEQEKSQSIAPPDINIKEEKNKAIKLLKKSQNFAKNYTKNIKLLSTSKNQIMSISTGLIPFLEHNDANRALMGSNMQRQALPLKEKEVPLIETGIEKAILKTTQMIKIAKNSGNIIFVSKNKIIGQEIIEKYNFKDNKSIKLKFKKSIINLLNQCKYKKFIYKIEKSRKSNQNTYLHQRPIIKQQEWVKKGQIITDTSGSFLGKLSIGKNILISYMCWEGYNFEDAIIINKQLVEKDIFTSIHTKKQKMFFNNTEKEEVRIRY